jgi:hypothetical protein
MPPDLYSYEKIECAMQGMRDYIKHLKRGYGRVTQMTALDIRNGRMSRSKADELVKEHEGKKPHSLEIFLDYVEMSEREFNAIVSKTVVAPHEPEFGGNDRSPKTHDFDLWYRERK